MSDPGLTSTELAPGSWGALWGQRLRWAQGWSQVALRYLWDGLRNRQLSVRQKVGLAYLLGWREIYPWISLQTFPILAFWMLRGSPPVSWFVPVFVATTLFTFSAGLVQAWTAWRLSAPEIRKHGRWFLLYGLVSQLFYVELKNVITRTAHLKEGMREKRWKVTPRTRPLSTRASTALARDSLEKTRPPRGSWAATVARRGERCGWQPHWIEGRELLPVPDALEDALTGARQEERPLIVFDSYERMTALGGYLRRSVLPGLPERAIVVVAGLVRGVDGAASALCLVLGEEPQAHRNLRRVEQLPWQGDGLHGFAEGLDPEQARWVGQVIEEVLKRSGIRMEDYPWASIHMFAFEAIQAAIDAAALKACRC